MNFDRIVWKQRLIYTGRFKSNMQQLSHLLISRDIQALLSHAESAHRESSRMEKESPKNTEKNFKLR